MQLVHESNSMEIFFTIFRCQRVSNVRTGRSMHMPIHVGNGFSLKPHPKRLVRKVTVHFDDFLVLIKDILIFIFHN